VPVKISLDGTRFYAGAKFYYNDKGIYRGSQGGGSSAS